MYIIFNSRVFHHASWSGWWNTIRIRRLLNECVHSDSRIHDSLWVMRIRYLQCIYLPCWLFHRTSHSRLSLVSNDVQRFEDAAPFAHYIWLSSLKPWLLLILCMFRLITVLSMPLDFSISIQSAFAALFGRLRRNSCLHCDFMQDVSFPIRLDWQSS